MVMTIDVFCPKCYKEHGRTATCVTALATDPTYYSFIDMTDVLDDIAYSSEKAVKYYKQCVHDIEDIEAKSYTCSVCEHNFQPKRTDRSFHVYGDMGEKE